MNSRSILFIAIAIVAVVGLSFLRPHMPKLVNDQQPEKPSAVLSYSCNSGKTIDAELYQKASTSTSTASVKLSDGRSLTLNQTRSADGARYANTDESFVFWSKGNGALVLENNLEKSYIGCILVKPDTGGLSQVYSNNEQGFSLRYPIGFTPATTTRGTKFVIPASMTAGTNLAPDSYLSVEQIPKAKTCSAALFVPKGTKFLSFTENGTEYSIATSSDAGAGNRYEETVYAFPGTNPCIATRYFVHYAVYENFPEGTVQRFDREALLGTFDQIRRTLTISQ